MELHQVRYFLTLCTTLSFTRAAEQCHVSQPALTTAIRKLEEEVGGPLFHREGKRLLLSELGRMMRPHLEQTLNQLEAARLLADNFRRLRQAPLNVGVMTTIGPVRVSRFLARFKGEHPGIEVAVHEGGAADLFARLDAGTLDLAIVGNPKEEGAFHADTLYRERYVVVFAPGHRFEGLDVVRLADVAGQPYVDRLSCELRDMVAAACKQRGLELYAAFRSEREDWVQGMVLAGIGFAFLPEYSVTLDGMLSRPLVEPAVDRTIALVRPKGRRLSPAGAALTRAAQAYAWPG